MQREEKQRDTPYEQGSWQMLPGALGHGTGGTAIPISELQERGLSRECGGKANRDAQKQEEEQKVGGGS